MDAILVIFTLVVAVYGVEEYKSVACVGDYWDRAISGGHTFYVKDTVKNCFLKAKSRGYEFFGVQYDMECYTSRLAGETYLKHGKSKGCKVDGKGGPWAMNVYRVITREYESCGCFKDKSDDRVILGGFSDFPIDTVHNCYLKAIKDGCDYFGVEHHTRCFCGKGASKKTYNKYGESNRCHDNGRGGPGAISVYHVIPEAKQKESYKSHVFTLKPETTTVAKKAKAKVGEPANIGRHFAGYMETGTEGPGEKITFPPLPSGQKFPPPFPSGGQSPQLPSGGQSPPLPSGGQSPPLPSGGQPINFPPVEFPPTSPPSGDSPEEKGKN